MVPAPAVQDLLPFMARDAARCVPENHPAVLPRLFRPPIVSAGRTLTGPLTCRAESPGPGMLVLYPTK